jgi:hypothetical protein
VGLINLEEFHFNVAKMSSSGLHETSCPGVEVMTTRQESLFQAAKMTKSCSTEAKILMTLEESNFQATKERLCGCYIPMGQGFLDRTRISFSSR